MTLPSSQKCSGQTNHTPANERVDSSTNVPARTMRRQGIGPDVASVCPPSLPPFRRCSAAALLLLRCCSAAALLLLCCCCCLLPTAAVAPPLPACYCRFMSRLPCSATNIRLAGRMQATKHRQSIHAYHFNRQIDDTAVIAKMLGPNKSHTSQ